CIQAYGPVTITQPDPLAIITDNVTHVSCSGGNDGAISISVTGGTAPYSYAWTGPGGFTASTQDISGLEAGDYQVMVGDNNGCTQNSDLITITQPPPMNILSETSAHVSCHGGNDGEIRIEAEGGVPPYTWSVNGGISFHSNNGVFTGLIANSYSVIVQDAAGCQIPGSTIVITEPDPIVFTVDTVKATCNHNTFDGQLEFSASGGTPPYSYSIDGGQNFQSGTVFSSLEGGAYTCIVRDQNGCEASQVVEIEGKFIVTADAGEDASICPGDEVVLNASGGDIYQWSPAEGLSTTTSSSPVASPESTTTYTVLVTKDLCYDSDEVTVTIYEVPDIDAGPDTAVFIGQSYQLTATGGPFSAYAWFPSTWLDNPVIADPVTTPEETTRYYVTGTSDEGCTATDSVLIRVATRLIIPSGFTPNNDEKNNTWKILNADLYPDMVVEVFNRWGERVFYSEGYSSDREWDGTYKGKDLPIGTYYYVIRLNDGRESRAITGPVTIIR
ncbi:MAG: gliding motility-associated C-terminal domain-containing protein, partial [Bacteroidales bacterium]